MKKLLIILLFMFGTTPIAPKFIKNYLDAYPAIKWIMLFLITIKKNSSIHYLLLLFIYIIFNLFDSIYFKPIKSTNQSKNKSRSKR